MPDPTNPVPITPSREKNGDHGATVWGVMTSIAGIAMPVMLTALGFLTAQVLENIRVLERLEGRSVTFQELTREMRAHESTPHPFSISRAEVREHVGDLTSRIERLEAELRKKQ
jgi:hypothetical protein